MVGFLERRSIRCDKILLLLVVYLIKSHCVHFSYLLDRLLLLQLIVLLLQLRVCIGGRYKMLSIVTVCGIGFVRM